MPTKIQKAGETACPTIRTRIDGRTNPRAETVAAMKAARRDELVKVGKPDKLLRSLNAGG
jgi:hypothetical protein